MTNRAEFERLLDVYGFRCERFGQDLSTHARAQVVSAFAALASAPVAGEAIGFVATAAIERGYEDDPNARVDMFRTAQGLLDYFSQAKPVPVYAAPQASEAVRAPDYTLQHADHMAVSAEQLMEAINARDAVIMQREESDDVDDETMQEQHENVSEYLSGMRNAIYEYRKRRNRAALSAQPGAQKDRSQWQHLADVLAKLGDDIPTKHAGEWLNLSGRIKFDAQGVSVEGMDMAHPDHKDGGA
ncbi:MAG: hypothetical protein K0S02_550 [Achromobacter mucicolens]|jgi:hypothetical protein|uniref:hypothetical protein n=1 Tax=Achromobacter mucicolens TaxID=1389922 RepID=UPI002430C830|nr:hypothetical protein [Achromobacter mucicolens]MDF2860278.1 hypothetical protein [Achromobacter mucicolens]